jgi:hypothetical protein
MCCTVKSQNLSGNVPVWHDQGNPMMKNHEIRTEIAKQGTAHRDVEHIFSKSTTAPYF